ncbi:Casein kinase I isoform alpha-like [Dinochytrium kinnereticum]|nr:Casein kinase I isoform alpha-like [Dinochytrium kinnereticum]
MMGDGQGVPAQPRMVRMPKSVVALLNKGEEIVCETTFKVYTIVHQLGKGGCGDVYLAKASSNPDALWNNGEREDEVVAIKVGNDRRQFLNEVLTMRMLNSHPGGRGFTPKLITTLPSRNLIIMSYLSTTLSHQFERFKHHFSPKTILMLAINMIKIVKEFHEKTGKVHVDIKPSNFCVGRSGRHLHLIDFGYASGTGIRLPGQTGTPLFMAVGIQTFGAVYPHYLDDLESIGYCLMYFIGQGKPGLPWGHLHKHPEIALLKSDSTLTQFLTTLSMNAQLSKLASPLSNLLRIARDRRRAFRHSEDFNACLEAFERCLVDGFGAVNDGVYDWVR